MIKVAPYVKKLLLEYPYYGAFLCGVNKKESTLIDTAGVCLNGLNYELMINKDFWESLTDDEKKGILMHEVLHLCFFHVNPEDPINKLTNDNNLLNIACDLEVQSYVPYAWYVKDKKTGEYVGTADDLRIRMNIPSKKGTMWYLKYLQQLKKLTGQDGEGSQSQNGSKDQSEQSGESNTSKEEKQQRNSPEGQAKSSYNQLSKEDKEAVKNALQQKSNSHDGWSKGASSVINKLVQDQIVNQMQQAAEVTKKSCGNLPREIADKLKVILEKRKPVFNWKRYFRQFLGTVFDVYQRKTRRKESNRFPDSPGMVLRKKHNILVAIDVSGSISSKEYNEFFNELHFIYKAGANVHIIEVDTRVVADYDYKGVTPQPHAGGGTAFLPGVEYYNQHRNQYSSFIYFTDGCSYDVEECKPHGKMLWLISSRGDQQRDYPGVKICIPKD